MKIFKKIISFFDKLEDHFRIALAGRPLLYAILGGIGVVLFYRGIWMTADLFNFMNGPISVIIGILILMSVGLLISTFVGDSIIISGLKREETEIGKLIEKFSRKKKINKKTKKK